MAGGGLTVLRGNDVYIGAAKESTWGTDVPPTWWWRWLDGTSYKTNATFNRERESDTGIHVTLVYKGDQFHEITVVEYGRPITLGYALQGIGGTSSDTLTAATKSTTLSGASNTAGSTTVVTVGDLTNIGTLAVNINPGYSNQTYEVVTLDLTTRTGTGPWTYTIANSGKLANGHSAGETVRSVSQHVIKPVATTYDPYTFEVGWGYTSQTLTRYLRFLDAVCYDVEIRSSAGKPLMCTHKWYAASVKKMAASTAPSWEGTNVIGSAGAPFTHFQGGSSWSVDSVTTGNAATIKELRLHLSREVNAKALISEKLTPAYFLLGNLTVESSIVADFQSFAQYDETVFGSTAPATSAVDSTATVFGQASVTFTSDAVNSLALSLPNQAWVTPDLPTPKNTSEPLSCTFVGVGTRSPSVSDPVQFTLKNSWDTAY